MWTTCGGKLPGWASSILRVRWTHIGEGAYEETEEVIKKLAEEEPAQTSLRNEQQTMRPLILQNRTAHVIVITRSN